MSEFFAMDGHGAYIWAAYGAAGIGMIALLALSYKNARDRARELRELENLLGARRNRRRNSGSN